VGAYDGKRANVFGFLPRITLHYDSESPTTILSHHHAVTQNRSHRMMGSVTRSGDIQDNTDSKLNFSHHFVGYYKLSIGFTFTNSKVQ